MALDTPPPKEERPIPHGFAVARIAVMLDRHTYEYVLAQRGRFGPDVSASRLLRHLLAEHETLTATVTTLERRLHALQRTRARDARP
jgi:hypothetical protein